MLTTQRARELFDYLPDGRLLRRIDAGTTSKAGQVAGSRRADGQIHVSADGRKYRAHHIVWIWHGKEIQQRIDHINRNPSDNRIENLRECSNAENGWNAKLSKRNTSGVKGVFWDAANSKWRVALMAHGKRRYFGEYEDLEFAELVAIEAREKYHGKFATSFLER